MNTQFLTNATLSIPAENLELIATLVSKLGGRLEIKDEELLTAPPMPEQERPGRMLKGLRLRAEMTQKELAEAIGVPQSHVSEYEKNKRRIPAGKAKELAKLLNSVPSNFLPKECSGIAQDTFG
jgi:DNA-binding transcriptional regulator YiaG